MEGKVLKERALHSCLRVCLLQVIRQHNLLPVDTFVLAVPQLTAEIIRTRLYCADKLQFSRRIFKGIAALKRLMRSALYPGPALSAVRSFIHSTTVAVLHEGKEMVPVIRIYGYSRM